MKLYDRPRRACRKHVARGHDDLRANLPSEVPYIKKRVSVDADGPARRAASHPIAHSDVSRDKLPVFGPLYINGRRKGGVPEAEVVQNRQFIPIDVGHKTERRV